MMPTVAVILLIGFVALCVWVYEKFKSEFSKLKQNKTKNHETKN
jgi:flagellar biogenesis protein FliO